MTNFTEKFSVSPVTVPVEAGADVLFTVPPSIPVEIV